MSDGQVKMGDGSWVDPPEPERRETIHDWLPGLIIMVVLIVCATVLIWHGISLAD